MKIFPLLFSLVLFYNTLQSQIVGWFVEAPSEVSVNGTFEVTFTLTNAEPKDVKFPEFNGFEILQGPSTSRSVSIINGIRSSTFGYGFTLLADKEGTYIITSATAIVNGKKLSTTPKSIVVKKSNLSEKDFSSDDILAKAELKLKPQTSAYVGQQVNAIYYIHYAENINMSSHVELPDFKGFFVKPLNVDNKSLGITTIGNKRFETLLVDALALYPLQTGELKIGKAIFPLKKKVANSRTFFDPFGSYVDKPIATNTAVINIKPLPSDAPDNFCGAVGDYKIEANLINKTAEKNGTLILKLIVTGDGDSKQMQIPVLNFGDQFEVFPGKSLSESEFVNNERLYHTKNIEYLITPKAEGQFTLTPGINIFNPISAKYEDINATPIIINIGKGKAQDKLNLFQDDNSISNISTKSKRWIYGLLGLSFIALLTFYFIRSRNNKPKNEIDPLELKRINAGKLALSKLSKAKQYMDGSAYNEFYKETGEAVNNYLQEKYQIATEDLNKTFISNFLSSFTQHENLKKQYYNISSKADLSIYGGYNNPNTAEVFQDAKSFIEALEMS